MPLILTTESPAIVLFNTSVISGGFNQDYLDDILELEPLTGQWVLVDRMIRARGWHAVSVLSSAESLELC